MSDFPVYNENDNMSEYFEKLEKYLVKKKEVDYNNIKNFINKWLNELKIDNELKMIEKFNFNENKLNNEEICEKILFENYSTLNLDYKLNLKNNQNEKDYFFKLIIKIIRKVLLKIDYKFYSYSKNNTKYWFIKKNDKLSSKRYNSDSENESESESD